MLEARSVSQIFGKKTILEEIDFTLQPGSVTTLLGPSGCGKSTLLRILAGVDSPSEGTVLCDGSPLCRQDTSCSVIMVWQSLALFPHMTVQQNVEYGLRFRGIHGLQRQLAVDEALRSLGLQGFGPRRIEQLSGGEQQRIALARAVVLRPRYLLLDEPLAGMDGQLRDRFLTDVAQLARDLGTGILVVSHNQRETTRISAYSTVMSRGRIAQSGATSDVLNTPRSALVARLASGASLIPGRITARSERVLTVETPAGFLQGTRAPWLDKHLTIGQTVGCLVDSDSASLARSGLRQESDSLEAVFEGSFKNLGREFALLAIREAGFLEVPYDRGEHRRIGARDLLNVAIPADGIELLPDAD